MHDQTVVDIGYGSLTMEIDNILMKKCLFLGLQLFRPDNYMLYSVLWVQVMTSTWIQLHNIGFVLVPSKWLRQSTQKKNQQTNVAFLNNSYSYIEPVVSRDSVSLCKITQLKRMHAIFLQLTMQRCQLLLDVPIFSGHEFLSVHAAWEWMTNADRSIKCIIGNKEYY